jgi:hypothetical protein
MAVAGWAGGLGPVGGGAVMPDRVRARSSPWCGPLLLRHTRKLLAVPPAMLAVWVVLLPLAYRPGPPVTGLALFRNASVNRDELCAMTSIPAPDQRVVDLVDVWTGGR